jgi:DNA-binding MarR family transcriptional regulator
MSDQMNTDFITSTGPAFLARRLRQLADQITLQGEVFLADLDISVSAKFVSVIHLLHCRGGISITEIASELGLSHQLCAQRITALKNQGLLVDHRDPSDRRKLQLQLSPQGLVVATQLVDAMGIAEQAYEDLFDEIGVDLFAATSRALSGLKRRPLIARTSTPETADR